VFYVIVVVWIFVSFLHSSSSRVASLFSITKGKDKDFLSVSRRLINLTIRVTIVCKLKDRVDKEVCLFARVQRSPRFWVCMGLILFSPLAGIFLMIIQTIQIVKLHCTHKIRLSESLACLFVTA